MTSVGLALLLAAGPALAGPDAKEIRRLQACAEVLQEVMDVPEGIPKDLLHKSYCVVVIPSVKKAALGVGGRFGKGAAVCRTEGGRGAWGAPLMVTLGGGSFGLQIGGQSSDYVFLVMNPKGIDNLLKSKFTLGADCSVAAGPKGRSMEAATDAQMRAEILTYSRSRGVFAGLSLEGAVLKQDDDSNFDVYGGNVAAREVLSNPGFKIPSEARPLVDALRTLSANHVSG